MMHVGASILDKLEQHKAKLEVVVVMVVVVVVVVVVVTVVVVGCGGGGGGGCGCGDGCGGGGGSGHDVVDAATTGSNNEAIGLHRRNAIRRGKRAAHSFASRVVVAAGATETPTE
jgi:hypothetical protein